MLACRGEPPRLGDVHRQPLAEDGEQPPLDRKASCCSLGSSYAEHQTVLRLHGHAVEADAERLGNRHVAKLGEGSGQPVRNRRLIWWRRVHEKLLSVADGARHLSLGVSLRHRGAFVVALLSFREGDLHLRDAVFEVHT